MHSHLFDHIVNILRSFEIEPKPLDKIVDQYYRRHKGLNSKERRLISDSSFEIMRWRERLDGVLLLSGRKVTQENRVDVYFAGDYKEVSNKNFPGGDAAFCSCPEFIYKRLVEFGGGNWARETTLALNQTARVVIRTNLAKANRDGLKKILRDEGVDSKETKFSPYGLILDGRINLHSLKSFSDRFFEVQDEGSQVVSLLVDAEENKRILDFCAGAGGKTLFASMLMGSGEIIATDKSKGKLKILRKRIKGTCGAPVKVLPPEDLKDLFFGTFDCVLVDVPCSGTGTLKRSPDLKWRINEGDLKKITEQQKEILESASRFVKPGGALVYITCSILPDENEEVAEWFKEQSSWDILPCKEILKIPELDDFATEKGFLRTDPSVVSMDGFFGAVFRG